MASHAGGTGAVARLINRPQLRLKVLVAQFLARVANKVADTCPCGEDPSRSGPRWQSVDRYTRQRFGVAIRASGHSPIRMSIPYLISSL